MLPTFKLQPESLFHERFRIIRILGEGSFATAYEARDAISHKKVALKIIKTSRSRLRSDDLLRFHAEIQALSSLEHPGIPKIYGAGHQEGVPFIAVELLNGSSLDDWNPGSRPFTECLKVAADLTRTLAFVHEKNILHRDIKPSNIMILDEKREQTPSTMLIDFGLAHVQDFGKLTEEGEITGTYGYMSPESLGATKRKTDERSDLYSLGAVLFYLVAGEPPFVGNSALEIIHRQLSLTPSDPGTSRSDVPEIFSNIVSKLLCKDPDDRYQKASALLKDLNRIKEGETSFVLSSSPETRKISFSTRVIGRDKELHFLTESIKSAQAGKGRCVLLGGEAGVGKTRIAEELGEWVRRQGGINLSAKCLDFENKSPLLPFQMILGQWVQQLARLGPGAQSLRIEKIKKELGSLSEIAIKVAPILESILGKSEPLIPLEGERETRRFYSTLSGLFRALSVEGEILVIHIDDLHWADPGSLSLFREIAEELSESSLFLLGTYRAQEISSSWPFSDLKQRTSVVENLFISRLDEVSQKKLIEESLGIEPEHSATLSSYLYQKQKGNPLATLAAIRDLSDKNLLKWTNGEWEEDWDGIRLAQLPETILPLLLRRIEDLSAPEKELLRSASVLGPEVETDLLFELVHGANEYLLHLLDQAIDKQFLERDVVTGRITFTHDRIREVFYSDLEPRDKKKWHQKVAEAISRRAVTRSPEVVFQLAHHYLEAGLGTEAKEIILSAARFARERHANETAIRYYLLELGEDPSGNREVAKELIQIYQRVGDNDKAVRLLELLLANPSDTLEEAKLNRDIGVSWFKKGDFEKCEKHLRKSLSILGERLPASRNALRFSILRELILHFFSFVPGLKMFLKTLRAKPPDEAREIAGIHVSLGSLYYFTSVDRAIYSILRNLNFSKIHFGKSKELGQALSGFGTLLMAIPFFKMSLRYHDKGIKMRREVGDTWGVAQSLQWKGFCLAWMGEYQAAETTIKESLKKLESLGDAWESIVCLSELGHIARRKGDFSVAFEYLRQGFRLAEKVTDDFMRTVVKQTWLVCFSEIAEFQKIPSLAEELKTTCIEKNFLFPYCSILLRQGYAYWEQNNLSLATKLLEESRSLLETNTFVREYLVSVYYHLLELKIDVFAKATGLESKKKSKNEIQIFIRKCFQKIKPWHNDHPGLFRSVGLAYAQLSKQSKALKNFKKSVAAASKLGRKFELARTYFVWGKYLDSLGQTLESRSLLGKALALFESFPNPIYVSRCRELLGSWSEPAGVASASSISNEAQRLRAVLSTSRHLSGLLHIDELLEKILQSACELVRAETGLFLVYEKGEDNISRRGAVIRHPASFTAEVSENILAKVEVERKPLIWDDAVSDLTLKNQPSVFKRQLKSIIAAPILWQNEILGILYLENNLVKGLFSPDDLETLSALTSQAGVSIQNARFTEELKNRERKTAEENRRLQNLLDVPSGEAGFGALLGLSESMRQVFRKLERIKDLRVNVLLLGESGTGKGLCAHEIHRQSPLRDKPFTTIECSSIPAQLLESELFGYERGAFTGAVQARKGKLENANGGTIFLDEIGELPMELQAKLLRFIQERVIVRLGGTEEIRLEVRVIAATNRNLAQEVREKNFREDLYYRLNEFQVELPPLRDRGEDVLFIAQEKLKSFRKELGKEKVIGFSSEAQKFLLAGAWPGNVRHLQAVIRTALIFADGDYVTDRELKEAADQGQLHHAIIEENQLRSQLGHLGPGEVERIHLLGTLEVANYNVSLAAERLGLSRTTLTAKMKLHQIKRPS